MKLRNKRVRFVNVLWRNHLVEGSTLEDEDNRKSLYQHLIPLALAKVEVSFP